MLRLFCFLILLTLTANHGRSQTPLTEKPNVLNWTMADGKSIDASVEFAGGDQVTMLVRTIAPVSIFDSNSKDRIAMLSKLPSEELLKHQQGPEAWTSSSGKIVSAIFDSVQGTNVALLVKKELSLSNFSEASRNQLQTLLDKDKVPTMDIGNFEVPGFELSTDQAATMDLTAKPDIKLDLTKKSPTNIKLERYKFDAKPAGDDKSPLKSPEVIKPVPAGKQPLTKQEEQAKLLARQQQRAAATQRIAGFMKEFEVLYSQRGDSKDADQQWKEKYDDFISRLDQSRRLDHDDLIAYSALAIAAAAVERGDQRAVVKNLMMLSEFLLQSR